MEKKKAKVTQAIYKKAINSSFGESHIFEITFDNFDVGQYFSKSKEQTTFKEGQEVEYQIEKKVNGNYTNTVIKPVQSVNGFVPGKGNPSYEHKRTALKCAVDLACVGKIELKQIGEYSNSFMKFLES